MHELLRQFAAEKLAAAEYAIVDEQHGRYYLAFVAERGSRLGRRERAEIQVELDNVRQAWQWAVRGGQIALLEEASYGWRQFCLFRGLEAESSSSLALAVEEVRLRLHALNHDQAARQDGERVLSKLLALHANSLFVPGRDEEMAAQASEAIALGVASGGVEGETFGSFVLGRALQELDLHHEAGAMWHRTIQLARAYQNDHGDGELLREAEWMALNWLRGYALHVDDFSGGRAYMEQVLQLCQALGKRRSELYCHADLA